jgi:protein subunit release factor B
MNRLFSPADPDAVDYTVVDDRSSPSISSVDAGSMKMLAKGVAVNPADDPITRDVAIAEHEIEGLFIRPGGPGGQNVSNVATAVQLRFDASRSGSILIWKS